MTEEQLEQHKLALQATIDEIERYRGKLTELKNLRSKYYKQIGILSKQKMKMESVFKGNNEETN